MNIHYYEDGSPKRCYKCGCDTFNDVVRSTLAVLDNGGGPAMEIEYFCANCGTSLAYWAYGSFDPSFSDSHSR
mgnify:CR=1 FL=1